MKRIIAVIILVVVLGLGLIACDKSPEQYSVQFDSDGGTEISAIEVSADSLLSEPNRPVKSGYIFVGWYFDENFLTPWDFSVDRVQSDMTLYAKWEELKTTKHTVTFDSCGGSYVATLRDVPRYTKISEPDAPTAYGFIFSGWFKDPDYETQWDFSFDVVSENITLYAKWIRNEEVASELAEWSDPSVIMKDWIAVGSVELHPEGACLEVKQPGSVSKLKNRITVPENRTFFTLSVRKFVREDAQNKDPKVYLTANGNIVRPEGYEQDYVSPDSDEYVTAWYDLGAFGGGEVVIEVYSTTGEHAAINRMTLCGALSDRLISSLPLYAYDLDALDVYEPLDYSKTQIFDEWKHCGSVVQLSEGTSLSVQKENPLGSLPESAVYAKFAIDDSDKYLHVSTRTFFGQNLGEDGNGYPPEMMVYVVDSEGQVELVGTKLIDSETELTLHVDLSDYLGQEITVIIGSGRGGHCALSYIELNNKGGGIA